MKSFFNYKLPNRKKWLLNKEFLTDFRDELDNTFKTTDTENKNFGITIIGLKVQADSMMLWKKSVRNTMFIMLYIYTLVECLGMILIYSMGK